VGDIYETFICSIETRYGAKYAVEDRKDMKKFLFKRYAPDREVLERLMEAIVEFCPKSYGIPDVAKVRSAADKYEDEYDRISGARQPSLTPYVPQPPTDEEVHGMEQVRAMARDAGIDTSCEGWFTAYLMRKLAAEHPGKLTGSVR
jgi:hypothetical protein